MLFQDSLGISFQEDRVSMVLLRSGFRKLRVAAQSVFALDPASPLSDRLAAVEGFLSDFQREHRLSSCDVFLSAPEEMVMTREVVYPASVRENLRATLRYEMEKHVPLAPKDILFDYQVLEEYRDKGQIRVLLVVAKRSLMDEFLRFGRRIGGGISGMETATTAAANGWAYRKRKGGRVSPAEAMQLAQNGPLETGAGEVGGAGIGSVEDAAALGLALRGLWEAPLEINLLPLEDRRRPSRVGVYAMAALVLLCLIAGAAWGGSLILRERMAARALESELSRLRAEVSGIQEVREEIAKTRARLDAFASLDRGYRPLVDVLRELTRLFPDTAWVSDFSYSDRGLQVRGYAASASELIGILEASPIFQNVVFLSAIVRDDDGMERFSIGMELEGGNAA